MTQQMLEPISWLQAHQPVCDKAPAIRRRGSIGEALSTNHQSVRPGEPLTPRFQRRPMLPLALSGRYESETLPQSQTRAVSRAHRKIGTDNRAAHGRTIA